MENKDNKPVLRIERAEYTNRSLRLKNSINDDIADIAAEKNMSFNAVAEILLEFALAHYDRTEEPKEDRRRRRRAIVKVTED